MLWCFITTVILREFKMSRLTIKLDDKIHRALKETAVRQNRSIGSIIEESLKLRGIRTYDSAKDLVAKARVNSSISANEAMALALEETKRSRQQR